jgi:hypothetical protein
LALPKFVKHAADGSAHGVAQGCVEGTEWFVEEDDLGADGEGPDKCDSLLLIAGQLVGIAPFKAAGDEVDEMLHGVPVSPQHPEADIPFHGEVGEQRAFLGYVAHVAVLSADRAMSVVDHLPTDCYGPGVPAPGYGYGIPGRTRARERCRVLRRGR